jgi:hypothetical protein
MTLGSAVHWMVYEGSKKRLIITTIWRWVWVGLMGLGTGITVILCGWSSRIQRSILFLQSVSRQGLLKMWMYLISFLKILIGWSKGNPLCILEAFHPQKLHIKMYFLRAKHFEFNRSWFFRFYRHFMTNHRFWTFEILQNWAYYWIHYIF